MVEALRPHRRLVREPALHLFVAVALLDDGVLPEQFAPERIVRDDVQGLLRRVEVRPAEDLSQRFPAEHACRVRINLHDGQVLAQEKRDYEGFHTRPLSWKAVAAKFDRLAFPHAHPELRAKIVDAVARLDEIEVADLTGLLAQARTTRRRTGG